MTRLIILLFLIVTNSFAYAETTGNLLPNVGDGVDWNSNSTDLINDGSSGYVSNGSTVNGFTITCNSSQANCGYKHDVGGDFEVTGTATVSADNIKLYSNTITQQMLDNGVTLNSYVDVANCDSSQGNCETKTGNIDSHSTTIKLKDTNGNVLSTITQTRNNPDGFQGNCNGYPTYSGSDGRSNNCGQYNDTIIYNNIGSSVVDWSWTGIDGNGSSSLRGGPNLLGSSLNMTYNSILLDEDIQEEINDIQIDDSFVDDIILDEIIWDFEEITFEDALIELDTLDFEEIIILDAITEFDDISLDNFEEIDFEEFEELDFEEMDLEDFEDIDFEELEEAIAEEPIIEEVIEDVAMEEEEISITEEEEIETVEETTEEIINAEETETKTTEVLKEEIEEIKEIADIEEIETEEIEVVNKDIKINVNDNIEIKVEEITLFSNNNALQVYNNTDFYKPQQIYSDMDNSLFIQADLGIYTKDIYTGITLGNYINTDPIGQHKQKMYDLKIEKIKIMIDLKKLKGLL